MDTEGTAVMVDMLPGREINEKELCCFDLRGWI